MLQKTDQHIVHLTTLTHLLLRDLIQGSAMEEADAMEEAGVISERSHCKVSLAQLPTKYVLILPVLSYPQI